MTYTRRELESMRVFSDIITRYVDHPDDCASLKYAWLGRPGGVTCPSDLDRCDDCGMLFFTEGVAWVNYADEDMEDDIRYCECCAEKNGHKTRMTTYGLGVDD